jgi:hypothetical protein
MRIQKAQKHTDPTDPDSDVDPGGLSYWSGSGSGTLDKNGLLRTWFGWLTMNIPLPLEEATGLTIHAPAEH